MKYHFEFDIELKRNTYSGLYIALEGIDGSGKTSQIDSLQKYFESIGRQVVTTREPRKNVGLVAEINNKALQGKIKIPRSAYQYLFTADRIMHLDELVIPALKVGKVVITDRSIWSAIPYGMTDFEEGFSEASAQILLIAQGIHNIILPDITFYIDIPYEISVSRRSNRLDTKEIYESEDVLLTVIEGYQWLIRNFSNLFAVVDGRQTIEDVTANMIKVIKRKL